MNDRFKFRVWYKITEQYIPRSQCILLSDGTLIQEIGGESIICDDAIVEQCTGLKDKNGNLIYDGDIVIWNDGNGECELKPLKGWVRIAEVKLFPSLHFKIIGCYPEETCEIGYEFHYGNFIYTDTEKYLKIVGNIHENPELLEQSNDD